MPHDPPPTTLRLLLVDDDALVLKALASALRRRLGCEVAGFTDPHAALAHARESALDLAIVDLGLPGMDGRALMVALRSARPGLRILVLTGDARPEALGGERPDDFVQKPVDGWELADRVLALAERPR
jgi:DNA-binding response OmpR family regulator